SGGQLPTRSARQRKFRQIFRGSILLVADLRLRACVSWWRLPPRERHNGKLVLRLGSRLLFALHIEVARKLTGMSRASFFEHSTGISRMTHQRGRAYAVLQQRREEVQAHADSLLLRMMRSQNTTHAEMEELR